MNKLTRILLSNLVFLAALPQFSHAEYYAGPTGPTGMEGHSAETYDNAFYAQEMAAAVYKNRFRSIAVRYLDSQGVEHTDHFSAGVISVEGEFVNLSDEERRDRDYKKRLKEHNGEFKFFGIENRDKNKYRVDLILSQDGKVAVNNFELGAYWNFNLSFESNQTEAGFRLAQIDSKRISEAIIQKYAALNQPIKDIYAYNLYVVGPYVKGAQDIGNDTKITYDINLKPSVNFLDKVDIDASAGLKWRNLEVRQRYTKLKQANGDQYNQTENVTEADLKLGSYVVRVFHNNRKASLNDNYGNATNAISDTLTGAELKYLFKN